MAEDNMKEKSQPLDLIYTTTLCTPEEEIEYKKLLEAQNFKDSKKNVTEFWKNKYEKESQKNWDIFYKRNTTNFYRDRHYLDEEFEEIKLVNSNVKNKNINEKDVNANIDHTNDITTDAPKKTFLEIGCGVGNALFPLLETNPHLYFYGIDFSHRAIELTQKHEKYNEKFVKTMQCDLVEDKKIPINTQVDFALMLFVLSSIHPMHYVQVLVKIIKLLNNNAYLLIRDYGRYDMAQLRFNAESKLAENFYVRNDATRVYYFTIEEMESLINTAVEKINQEILQQQQLDADAKVDIDVNSNENKTNTPLMKVKVEFITNHYCKKVVVNRKTQVQMHRIWVQTKIKKLLLPVV